MKMWLANGYKMDVGKVLRTVPKNGYSLELKLDDRLTTGSRFLRLGIGMKIRSLMVSHPEN